MSDVVHLEPLGGDGKRPHEPFDLRRCWKYLIFSNDSVDPYEVGPEEITIWQELEPPWRWARHVVEYVFASDPLTGATQYELVRREKWDPLPAREGERLAREAGYTIPPRKASSAKAAPSPSNAARDDYIIKRRERGVPFKQIVIEVNRRKKWEHFDNPSLERRTGAAWQAMRRRCNELGLERPTRKPKKLDST
jgi:hypothetical protein